MKMDEKLIQLFQIPWKVNGRDYSGADCWGFVCLAAYDLFGIEYPSYCYDLRNEDREIIANLMLSHSKKMKRNQTAKAGNIVLLTMFGHDSHVGLMLNEFEFLHIEKGIGVNKQDLRNSKWANKVRGYFENASTA